MPSFKGRLLVAALDMPDSNFSETVILLVEHSDDGAYGLIVNRPTNMTVKEAWEQNHDTSSKLAGLIYFGGPCGDFLTAIHGNRALSNIEASPGIHFTQDSRKLELLVEQQVGPIKFFVGFAGWGEGQLESEMADGSWLALPASPEHIFSLGDDLWPMLIRELVGEKVLSALRIKHRPDDPSVN